MNLYTHNTSATTTPQALPAHLTAFVTPRNKTTRPVGTAHRLDPEGRAMADALRDAAYEYGADALSLMFSFDEEI